MPASPERSRLLGALTALALAGVPAAAEEGFPGCEAIWQTSSHGRSFYEYNPTYTDPAPVAWPVSEPEAQGMRSDRLVAGIGLLLDRPTVESVLVVRHGVLVAERYAAGGTADDSRNVHSASKSILGALAGIALAAGAIGDVDDPIALYLPEAADPQAPLKGEITVRHLLTMASGLAWEEDRTEYRIEDDDGWVEAILAQRMDATPGRNFLYSTGGTHLLSAVIAAATGMSTCDYAMARLFGPLGIAPEHWGRDPEGVYSGGYNLYLTARELALFGQLYLQRGAWESRQVVPAAWVDASWTTAWDTGAGWDYGYLWWLTERDGLRIAVAWGWRGQLVYVVPELDVVVVVTTDTSGEGPPIDAIDFVAETVIPAVL